LQESFAQAIHAFDALHKPSGQDAVALGRLGGLKGGKARASKLTSEQRKEIAKKAAQARWSTKQAKE
jgi:hypothetical protein